MKSTLILLSTFLLPFLPQFAQAQQPETSKENLRVFVDCNRCNRSFIRQEITLINYVRDKEVADVHLIITRQRTGSDGTEYTLRFIGTQYFGGQESTIKYISAGSDTKDEERRGLVRMIKIGLTPYVALTDAVDNINVSYQASNTDSTVSKDGDWNSWVFELNGRAFFSGEESQSSLFFSGGASADRVTEQSKINLKYGYDYNRRTFTETDSLGNKSTDVFITRGQGLDVTWIKSLTNHWSAGFFADALSSSRNNIDFNVSASPGVEYNIYPYEEYSQREISFAYLISTGYYDYEEVTIFDETSEWLMRQRLRSRLEFTQPWGEIEGRINASAFMHDLRKNRLDIRLEFDFRVFRGLSLSISGRYSVINDQLSIPKGDISDAEQLLNLRQQATSYSYRGFVGIEYTFGSIYNNVVNPRF